MAEILAFKRPAPAARNKGKTLCKNGFHHWVIQNERPFDVKLGRLLTLYRCARCGRSKTVAT